MKPTIAQIDALMPFQATFAKPGFQPSRVIANPGEMPYEQMHPKVLQFIKVLYKHEWVTPFDWGAWQDRAEQLVNQPARLRRAGFLTIQRLFTTHVRKDRFCEGHFAAMIENGHIVEILKRLETLRSQMSAEDV